MKRKLGILTMLLALVLSGCGAGAPGGADPGDPPPPPSGSEPFTGRLVADGTSIIHTMDLPGGTWTRRLNSSVYNAEALHLPGRELFIGGVSLGSDLTVAIHDLDNFAIKSVFVWPNSAGQDVARIEGLAISRDGKYAAAMLRGSGPDFLEIIDIAERQIVHSQQLTPASLTDLQWLDGNRLVIVLDLQPATPELAGAIAAVSLDELIAGGDTIEIDLLVSFNEEQWALAKPHSMTFSHDLTQIAYSYQGDIWAGEIGEAPHQLTYGPTTLTGPAFSPDGDDIAFVEHHSYAPNPTFVMPNHRGSPLFVDGNGSDTDAVLLEDSTLVDRMLVWLPR